MKTKTAKSRSTRRPTGWSARSILVPVDFSRLSTQALVEAARQAKESGAQLIVLHVVEPVAASAFPGIAPLLLEDDRVMAAAKEQLKRLLRDEHIPARLVERTLVRMGRSHAEITDAARTLKAGLIVMSTHGRTGLKHTLLGSTAEQVVRHAPCPVLVWRSTNGDGL